MRTLILISMLAMGANVQAGGSADRDLLAARRAKALDALHDYWVRGEFPINVYRPRMVNIFRDGGGRLCAVANLIHASGHDDLVDAQVRADDFVALRDLRGGAIADWILASGLTREEIVDLQGLGYESTYEAPNLIEAPNGGMRIAARSQGAGIPAAAFRLVAERAALRTRLSAAEVILRAQSDRSLEVAGARLRAAAQRASR